MRTKCPIKDGLGGPTGSRTNALQQYNKSENKPKKDMKYPKKQNKMLYSIAKKSGSRRDIKKTRAKDSKKTSESSSDDVESDSLLAIYSSWEIYIRPAGRKEMNRLDPVVTDNLNNYKDQSNEAINSDMTFDTNSFNLSSGTS